MEVKIMKNLLFIMLGFLLGMVSNAQTVADIEGNEYKTVTIGKQVWMAENLKATKLRDGTSIPLVEKDMEWANLSSPGACWYENNLSEYGKIFGALYNWHVVKTGKLCPEGWHVPADKEWSALVNYLGGKKCTGKLREPELVHWKFPNTGATNESGFTALPSGRRNAGGNFSGIGEWCYFWSTTNAGTDRAWYRGIGNADLIIDKYSYNINSGFSVRCLKD
jgi:uncharacterized protein (TIGR02145 family)